MDFLDPAKQRRHSIMIMIGYLVVGLAIFIATIILLYYAYGYKFSRDGQVVQKGLMFVSSAPNPANIYLNGKLYKSQTNTRVDMDEGTYTMDILRDGYRKWTKTLIVDGGKVVHYDYPLLIPDKFTSSTLKTFDSAPTLSTQSPDKRWLVLNFGNITQFDIYDFKDPKNIQNESITVPGGILTASAAPQSWKLVEWSNDNKHILLKHLYGADSEYILVDRSAPDKTLNLTKLTGSNPTELSLLDKRYDRYLLFFAPTQILMKATLSQPSPVSYVDHVLAYKSYGTDVLAYVASAGPDTSGDVRLKLLDGDQSYVLRELPHGSTYYVDISRYSNKTYVAAGAASEGKTYVYEDPIAQIRDRSLGYAVPIRVLKTGNLLHISFSSNSRFVLAEGSTKFAISDAEDDKGYSYAVNDPMDLPQTSANWMDGHHLSFVSNGKIIIFDFDSKNRQELVTANPQYLPVYNGDYRYMYSFTADKAAPSKVVLQTTPLRTPADL